MFPEADADVVFSAVHNLVAKKPLGASAKTSHVHLLKAALPVFLGMVGVQSGFTRFKALKAALQLCGHRYPKIREIAAQAVEFSHGTVFHTISQFSILRSFMMGYHHSWTITTVAIL